MVDYSRRKQPGQHIYDVLTHSNSRLAPYTCILSQLRQLSVILKAHLPTPLSAHCQPLSFKESTLCIGTDGAHWGTLLRYQLTPLRKQLREHPMFSELKQITVRILPDLHQHQHSSVQHARKPEPPKTTPPRSALSCALIQQLADATSHPGLQQALQKLASSHQPPCAKQ